MARYVTHPSARSFLTGGIVAGLIGGFFLDAFLFAVGMAHYPSWYRWIASGIVGPGAVAQGGVWIGIVAHFAIAAIAATVYAYVAQITGLLGRPILGGALFGIVTNGVMDFIVYARDLAPLPSTWHDIILGLVAHVIFFGIPVALFLAKYERVPIPYV